MIQQQLVDYIKSQIALGLDKEAIKSALLEAGWTEADINDSMVSVGGESGAAQKIPAAGFAGGVGGESAARSAPEAASRQTPIVVSDLLGQSKLDFVSRVPGGKQAAETKKPAAQATSVKKEKAETAAPKFGKAAVALVVLGLVALAAASGAVFFYLQNRGLQDKLAVASSANDAANSKVAALNSQIDGLTAASSDANSKLSSLKNDNQELLMELSFFAVPAEASSTEKMEFTVQGKIGGGGGTQYTLTTKNGAKIYIQNYKDAKVDAALKSLVGQNAEVSGDHLPGSRNVTVTAVNGSSLQ